MSLHPEGEAFLELMAQRPAVPLETLGVRMARDGLRSLFASYDHEGALSEVRDLVIASAGGNLAAAVNQVARERDGPTIRYQLLVYPLTKHGFDGASYRDFGDGHLRTRSAMEWHWNQNLPVDAAGARPLASPLRAAALAGLPPPELIITAEYDPLRDGGEAYARRWRSQARPVREAPGP